MKKLIAILSAICLMTIVPIIFSSEITELVTYASLATIQDPIEVSDTLSTSSTKISAAQNITTLNALTAGSFYIFNCDESDNYARFFFVATSDATDVYTFWLGKKDDTGNILLFDVGTISVTYGTKVFDATMEFADTGTYTAGDIDNNNDYNSPAANGCFYFGLDVTGADIIAVQKTTDGSDSKVLKWKW